MADAAVPSPSSQTGRLPREGEGLYRQLVDLSPDAIFVQDRERILFANPAMAKMLGASGVEQIIGRPVADIVYHDDQDFVGDRVDRIIGKNEPSTLRERRWRRLDGSLVIVEVTGHRILWNDQFCVQAVARDITERKQLEREIQESESRFRMAVEAADFGTWDLDLTTRVMNCSARTRQIAGIGADEVITADRLIAQVHPDDQPVIAALGQKAQSGTESQYDIEYRVMRPDGSMCWVRLVGKIYYRMVDGQLVPMRSTGLVRDITERKGVEARMRKAYEELEERVRERTAALDRSRQHFQDLAERNRRLVLELDHRVRNNIAGLISLSTLLKEQTNDVAAFAQAMESRLLALSRTQSLLTEGKWGPVELENMVRSTLAAVQPLSARPIALVVDGPRVYLDADQVQPLAMVLAEFFNNSCKHGAMKTAAGQVVIDWKVAEAPGGRRVQFRWREENGPPVPQPVKTSLGLDLVNDLVVRELRGACLLGFPPSGVKHEIEFPCIARSDHLLEAT